MKERQQRITIKDSQGRVFKTTYRDNGFQNHQTSSVLTLSKKDSNISIDTKVGDVVYWRECDMYLTKREGTVIESIPLFWNWSKPVGQRAEFI